jgi:hypothetical protein
MKRLLYLKAILLLCGILTAGAFADPPPNDDCINADNAGTLVAGVPVQLTGTTVGATQDCMMSFWPEVWIKFTLDGCMDVTIDFCDDENSVFEVSNELYAECPCMTGIYADGQNSCPNSNPSIYWYNLGAGTYYYAIYAAFGEGSPYTINVTGSECAPPPANDSCVNAIAINEVTDLTYSTRLATFDGEGTCNYAPNIWYVYTPTFTGDARIKITESDYSYLFAVYDGSACSPLPMELGCVEDDKLDFSAVMGQQYLIEIGGMFDEAGDALLYVGVVPPPPPNDDCADASDGGTLVSGVPVQLTGSNEEATQDCDSLEYPEVWVKFTVAECMDVTIDYCGTDPPADMYSVNWELFDTCPCGGSSDYFELTHCPDGNVSMTWLGLGAGTYYYPILNNYGLDGPYVININGVDCPAPPANDSCQNATDAGTLVAGVPVELAGTNLGATNDCEYVGTPEVWITFTLDEAMHVKIDYCGTDPQFETSFDYLFDDCPCGEPIGHDYLGYCEDYNFARMWYNLQAGTYWYPIIATSGARGDYVVHVTGEVVEPPPVPIPVTAPDTVEGTTCGALNNCYHKPGEDVTYEVTIPAEGDWIFSLCGSDTVWDSYLILGLVPCDSSLGTNDDGCGEYEGQAELITNFFSAGTYYLTVDSRNFGCGDYTLHIIPVPGPCDGSYYSNGDADYLNAVEDYRSDTFEAYGADDFTLTETVTISSIVFIGASSYEFWFNGTGDYQILGVAEGGPDSVLYEGIGVPCSQTPLDEMYQGMNDVYAYRFDDLGISLEAGTYFLACRPVAEYSMMPNYWLTTDSQTGSMAYYKDTDNPDWALAEVNADLAFCLFTAPDNYAYLPGDANMYNGVWPPSVVGSDATYMINYFRGMETSVPCPLDGFWASADANGDCSVIGSDVTKLVNYLRGQTTLSHCEDYPPAWLTPGDLPVDPPAGWPNCETGE